MDDSLSMRIRILEERIPMFQGLHVALVTPFTDHGEVDLEKVETLVKHHIEEGTDGLVLCGTTGENPCLTDTERQEILEAAVASAAGRIQIIAGAGARSTPKTVANVKAVREAGADGALVVTPFYNRPGQEALEHHFRTVAETCDLPLMLYNVPARTGVDLLPETVARLADHPNIAALKEAKADLDRLSELVLVCEGRLDVLSGHDPNLLPALSAGCRGIVSVMGNIVPRDVKELFRLFETGDSASAKILHLKLFTLCRALAVETNPVPIKGALNLLGWDVGEVRPPLLPLAADQRVRLRECLLEYGFRNVREN
jgi:4-hydroxy-tetrahydrodipicolinate synthase